MPTYTAKCEKCNSEFEYIKSISESKNTPLCCGEPSTRTIKTAPISFVKGRFEAFKSSVDGSIITSERSMREHNARNGVVNLADGYSDEAVRKGAFNRREERTDMGELRRDIGEAIEKINYGYVPSVEVHHGS